MTGTTTTRRGLSSGEEFLANELMGGETPPSVFGSAPIETVRSIAPSAVNLVNVHPPAWEIEIRGKRKHARRPIISQRGRLVRRVGVVGGEQDFFFGCGGAEQHHGVVDGQARKTHQVHDRRPVALNVGGELFGGSLLTVPGERPEHPPMPALKIAPT